MTYTAEQYVQHENPVWRNRSNFIFNALIPEPTELKKVEQLWGRKVGDVIEVCCIPYYLYDVNLGDLVSVTDDFYLDEVVADSGHFTFRALMQSATRATLSPQLTEFEADVEWFSDRLVAIDCANLSAATALADLLLALETSGQVSYETGRT